MRLILISALLLFGSSNVWAATNASERLTAVLAQEALVQYVRAHPEDFVSPGNKESPEELQKVEVANVSTGL